MNKFYALSEIAPGELAVVSELQTTGAMRRRLQDLGLVEHTAVQCLGRSPSGDPTAFFIRGAVIALRKADSETIFVERAEQGRGNNGVS